MYARCLLIDDDPDVHFLFEAALHDASPQIEFVGEQDSEQALIQLQNPGAALPDIIFLDLNMPRLDGRQCLSRLKALPHLSPVPIVIFSTSDYLHDIGQTRALGSAGYVVKPDTYTRLIEALKLTLLNIRADAFFLYGTRP